MKPRFIGVATGALGLCLAAAACTSSGTTTSAAAHTHTTTPSAMPGDTSTTPSNVPVSGSPAAAPNGTGTIGASCAKLPAKGTGSVSGMASEPVATAIAHNPQLTNFSRAITAAGLTNALNSAKAITVFAPSNSALAALGTGNVKTLMGNKADLIKVIQYHIVSAQVTPANLAAGKPIPTQLGLPVHPAKSGDKYKVNNAEVACGNIATSNATLYIISKVLIPTT
jgi:uncharacterized surface protein with fasciclin (FAS1) repeats